jgi:hypothetical protein
VTLATTTARSAPGDGAGVAAAVLLRHKYFYFPVLVVSLALLLSAAGLHGSSVGMFHHDLFGPGSVDPDLLAGQPRAIRSDEWMIASMLHVAQVRAGFQAVNPNVGLGQNIAAVRVAPALSWKTLFHPQVWPFFVLPLEQAFALHWWLRAALLLVGFYVLLLELTSDLFLSVLGSMLLFFSPFVQWWYGSVGLDALGFLLVGLVASIRGMQTASRPALVAYLLGLSYCTSCFLFVLYPPSQISLAWLGVALLLGYVLERRSRLPSVRRRLGLIVAVVGVTLVLDALIYRFTFEGPLRATIDSLYPGQRRVPGGGLSLERVLAGFFGIFLLADDRPLPSVLPNQSEGSGFFMLFPFAAPVVAVDAVRRYRARHTVDWLLLATCSYLVLGLLWMSWGLPRGLAGALLLDQVPTGRMTFGVGMASLVGLILFLNAPRPVRNPWWRLPGLAMGSVAGAVHLYIGVTLGAATPPWVGPTEVAVVAASVAVLMTLLVWRETVPFAVAALVCGVLSCATVNPLYRGIRPIVDTELAAAIREIDEAAPSGTRWVAYEYLPMGNYLAANGVSSLSATQVYPEPERWATLDPEGNYAEVHSRFAHLTFVDAPLGGARFELIQNVLFVVHVNPCEPALEQIGATYFVFSRTVEYPCLRERSVVTYPAMTLRIFERVRTTP